MLCKTLGILLGISLTSAVAHAAEPAGVAAAPTVTPVVVAGEPQLPPLSLREAPTAHTARWYGGPSTAVDAGVFGLLAVGSLTNWQAPKPVAWALVASFSLSGPVNHALHGNWGRAGGSLAMRVTMPLVGGIANFAVAGGCHARDCPDVAPGILIGALLASAVDNATMSWESVPQRKSSLAPIVAVGKDTAYLGASGEF